VALIKVRGIIVQPGQGPKVLEFEDSVAGLQAAVGGTFERFASFPLGPERVANLWRNNNASVLGLPPNCLVRLPGNYEEVILGPIVITAAAASGIGDGTETYSLTEDEIRKCAAVMGAWSKVRRG